MSVAIHGRVSTLKIVRRDSVKNYLWLIAEALMALISGILAAVFAFGVLVGRYLRLRSRAAFADSRCRWFLGLRGSGAPL